MLSRLSRFCIRLPRVFALLAILLLTCVVLFAWLPFLEWRVHFYTRDLVPVPLFQKNQGILLQREAFANKAVLPLYGSSELTREEKNRASEFFANAPTGFQVCPVGVAGNTSLLTLEKIASLGNVVRGRKMAFILSPSWFMRKQNPADHYAGNFSALQTMRAIVNPRLSDEVKRGLAGRMLDYPETLDSHPMLLMQARLWREEAPFVPVTRAGLAALLMTDAIGLEYEDTIQSGARAVRLKSAQPWHAAPREIEWGALVKADSALLPPPPATTGWHGKSPSPMDTLVRESFAKAEHGEWFDFELLLQATRDLGIDALMITMPLAGVHRNLEGVLPETRTECYYARIEALCRRHHVAVKSFADHDLDPYFLVEYTSHPTAVGWLHINRVLDDFFHNRYPPKS